MKKITLVRHGKSDWTKQGLSDFDRPLNNRGKTDAPIMGKKLKSMNILPDLILCSPAKRAVKTAGKIAKEIGYTKKNIVYVQTLYGGDERSILNLIKETDDAINHLMIFGHNPDLTQLAVSLTGYQIDNIPTCGVFHMQCSFSKWQEADFNKCEFVFLEYPKKHMEE